MYDKQMSEELRVPAETPKGSATPPEERADTPFQDDELLFFEGSAIRNELGEAQSDPEAARLLSARHIIRLLYDPNRPWRGRMPYPRQEYPGGTSGGR